MNPATIGRIILYHRKRAGLSRRALSDLSGVSESAIYEVEHGKETVRFDTLLSLFAALNVTLRLESPLMGEYERQEGEHDG